MLDKKIFLIIGMLLLVSVPVYAIWEFKVIKLATGTTTVIINDTTWYAKSFQYMTTPIVCNPSTEFCLSDTNNVTTAKMNDSGVFYYYDGFFVDSVDTLGDGEYLCNTIDSVSCDSYGGFGYLFCYNGGSGTCHFSGTTCDYYAYTGTPIDMSDKSLIIRDINTGDVIGWIAGYAGRPDGCFMGVFTHD